MIYTSMLGSENNKWFFPIADYGTKQGLNDSGLETFLDKPLDSLVRETIQNSLDAKYPEVNKPVCVKFNFFDIPIKDFPGFDSLKDEYITKAKDSWEKESQEYKHLQNISYALENNSIIKMLRIADYNTTGLNEENWDALIKEAGVSKKSDNQAAGNKGIGKNAPFAASEYRTVVYNTKTDMYDKSIGVTIGVSFNEVGGNGVSQSRGYLGSSYNNPFEHQYSFLRDRNDVGTDVFIVGVRREYADSQKIIKLNVLEHFMLSIHTDNLEVEIDGDTINKESLYTHIIGLASLVEGDEEDRLKNILSYYFVLTSDNTQVIKLDNSFVSNYSFIKSMDDATFYLLQLDQSLATNKVLETRKSGMAIKCQPFRMGVYFSGIFQATGLELNTFLRQLESAEHNNWSAERIDFNSQIIAKKFLRDLDNFLRENIRSLIKENSDEVIDAYGLAELLPDESDAEMGKENDNPGSITPILASVNIKPVRRVKQQLRYSRDEPEIDGGDDGDGPGESGRRTPTTDSPDGLRPNPNPPKGSPTPILVETQNTKIRAVEIDYKSGKYLLRIIPDHTLSSAIIKVAAAGENGDYSLSILYADESFAKSIRGDSIQLSTIPENVITDVEIKINTDYRLRLKVVIYESK